jgi:translation initiation factor 2B subunit (eIF-2B alpha/beta/delta family)
MTAIWQSAVESIRLDNRSGASALLRRAADALRRAAATGRPEQAIEAARMVARARPAMGALCRLASATLVGIDTGVGPDAVREAIDDFMAGVEASGAATVDHMARLIGSTDVVVTLSASSLVERTIMRARRVGRVICLESRPACEGVDLAGRLAQAGVPTTLVSDAAGPSVVAHASLVLLGGDTLAPAGLVHKVGTLGLALAARRPGIRVYALCGEEKWLPALLRGALDDGGPPQELVPDPAAGLSVENPYFDLTPLELLDGIVGSDGVVDPSEAGRRAEAITIHEQLRGLLDVPWGRSMLCPGAPSISP